MIEAREELAGLHVTRLAPITGSPVATVILVAGSGPTDRDGNSRLSLRTDALKKLAEGLRRRGIASVRYDKRFLHVPAAALREEAILFDGLADDLLGLIEAVARLPSAGPVVLLGHSEGGIVALAAAQGRTDVAGLVALATPGRRIGRVIRDQLAARPLPGELAAEAERVLAELEAGRRVDAISPALAPLLRPSVQPFLISLLAVDPAQLARQLALPMMIVGGGRDLQVGRSDFDALVVARPDATVTWLADMNHVLVEVADTLDDNIAAYSEPARPLARGLDAALADFVSTITGRRCPP